MALTPEQIDATTAAINVICHSTAGQPVTEPAKNDTAYAELPEPDIAVGNDGRALIYTSEDIVGEPYYTADQLRAYADATCALRASHGQAPATAQADSVPAVSDLPPLPAPDLRDVGTTPQEIKEFLKGYATEYARTAIAARAPADSAQEDADRHFFDAGWKACANFCDREDVRFDGIVGHRGCPQFEEAFRAARKQGASHDR